MQPRKEWNKGGFVQAAGKKRLLWLFSVSTKARRKNNVLNYQKLRCQADMIKAFPFFKDNREESAKRL